MQIIQAISDYIKSELKDAKSYANAALMSKDTDKELAASYYALSQQEIEHAHKLHEHVTRIIADYRKTKGDPPSGMLQLYNYKHQEQIECEAETRRLWDMYKA